MWYGQITKWSVLIINEKEYFPLGKSEMAEAIFNINTIKRHKNGDTFAFNLEH